MSDRHAGDVGRRYTPDMSDHPLSDASAERLSHLLSAGDEGALEESFARWGGLVHGIALRSVRHADDAQDVTQQVFVSAWRSRHTLRPGPNALPRWLVGITRNVVSDLHGQRRRVRRDADASTGESVVRAFDDDVADRVYLRHELGRLGSPREDVVRLAVMEGYTHAEIADLLDLPMGTVKSHVRRGLQVLRDRLEEVRRDPS